MKPRVKEIIVGLEICILFEISSGALNVLTLPQITYNKNIISKIFKIRVKLSVR